MQQIKIYKTFVAICRWQFALAHTRTHTWRTHTRAHTHISAQFGQMSPTWQPVPALLSVRAAVRLSLCCRFAPKTFTIFPQNKLRVKMAMQFLVVCCGGRCQMNAMLHPHTHMFLPPHTLSYIAVQCVLGPCSCNVCPIEFNNIFIWILVSREYFPAIFTSSRKTATAPSVALAVALCASVTCPLKCFCHLWLKIGPELVSRANTTWCVLPCRNTAPKFEIEESHSTHWAMAIELIGSRGACCVANFVYNVVSLVSPL